MNMILNKTLTILLFATILSPAEAQSWEPYDRVIAVVNNRPIIQSEIESRLNFIKESRRLSPAQEKTERDKLIEKHIEDALVAERSEEMSIIISDKKLSEHLKSTFEQFLARTINSAAERGSETKKALSEIFALKEKYGYVDVDRISNENLKSFALHVQKNEKMDFDSYIEELRNGMKREQLMSIAIGASPPSEKEAMAWYNANRSKLGYEVHVKHILIRPSGNSFKAQRDASVELENLRKRVLAGESFEALAAKHSEDPGSRGNGGDLGWVMLAELDPLFASAVFQMKKYGEISPVIKSSFGYHVIKYLGRKQITYDRVKNMIMNRLYYENMTAQFSKWIEQRKKESEIIIYN